MKIHIILRKLLKNILIFLGFVTIFIIWENFGIVTCSISKGNSMLPTFSNYSISCIYKTKNVKVGDVVDYYRYGEFKWYYPENWICIDSSRCPEHRIVGYCKDGRFKIKGDNILSLEECVNRSQIIGKVILNYDIHERRISIVR